jgi:hypothetical protein
LYLRLLLLSSAVASPGWALRIQHLLQVWRCLQVLRLWAD